MATWSSRRRLIYGGSIIFILVAAAIITGFSLFYKAPTCFDGLMNGSEQDIDCGGACVKLCQSAFLSPKIMWGGAKYEKMAEGFYNLAAYVANPNSNGAATNVPYKFSVFDAKGTLIIEKTGAITLPAHRNTLAFETAVNMEKRIPAKATFEFTKPPVWFKSHDTLDGLSIVDKKYSEDETGSSLEITIENRSLLPFKNITVGAVLYDGGQNVIGFSRTKIDEVQARGGREIAPFTWPVARQGRVTSIEALPVAEPVRDR